MDVDVAGESGDPCDERSVDELVPPAASARAEHELGRLLAAGERDQRLRGVVADDLVDRAAELGHELALRGEGVVVVLSEPVVDGDVHADQVAADPPGHAAARRIDASPPANPVMPTTTRSRVSHASAMPCASR